MKINENTIINEYLNNKSCVKTCKKYHISHLTLRKILEKNNIKIINYQNRTKFNEHIFDSIDTEEKAYWLGFIFADGYLSSRDNAFELSLSLNDKEHLDKFNKFMQHEKDNVKTDSLRCRWSVTNKHLWTQLNKYGYTPKKSLTLVFPDINIFANPNLIIHFIRGYIDGDGSIFITTKNSSPRISILGTKTFLEKINSYLLNDNNKLTKNHKSDLTWSFTRASAKAVAISYMIYYKSNIYLNRKYNIYTKYCAAVKSDKNGEAWDGNPVLTY